MGRSAPFGGVMKLKDDAAVYDIGNGIGIISTTVFFYAYCR
ncbi:hypothetical protein AAUPMC_08467 [Pasteurella multocida subsp. multocida str. Anand1_cattle]|nr:hypothetical protein AAUPMC_08467 [Pasteurella multocida subsp. multocida str. Anand1_cattle]